MLITIALILAALWLLGLITKVVAGGLIHLLIVIAVVVFIYHLIKSRRAV